MAMPCKAPMCNQYASKRGYCNSHQPQRSFRLDWSDNYNKAAWIKMRRWALNRNPLCMRCSYYNITREAIDVDHIVPHKGDSKLFNDYDNIQTLCHSCHSWKTSQEKKLQYYSWRGGKETLKTDPPSNVSP